MSNLNTPDQELPSAEVNKARIESFLAKARTELGVGNIAKFEGYYHEDSNGRAKRSDSRTIAWNDKYLGIPDSEKERVAYHETQHVFNTTISRQNENPEDICFFVFHPTFVDLHTRMKAHYESYFQKDYEFAKAFSDIPQDYEQFRRIVNDYTNYDEVLALLRGYETYLKQLHTGQSIQTQPYEFIEAFKPEDLKLLDPTYRKQITQQVLTERPDILTSINQHTSPLSITAEDIAKFKSQAGSS